MMTSDTGQALLVCSAPTTPPKKTVKRVAFSPITNCATDHGISNGSFRTTVSNENLHKLENPVPSLTPSVVSTSARGTSPLEALVAKDNPSKPTRPILSPQELRGGSTTGLELIHDPILTSYSRVRHLKNEGGGEIIAATKLDLLWINGIYRSSYVVLKVFKKKDMEEDPAMVDSVLNELLAYQRMEKSRVSGHPFLLNFQQCFESMEHIGFVLDHLPRWTLSYILKHDRGRRDEFKRKWVAQMAKGISAIHAIGLIHRDIRPENILVESDDTIRIGGFAHTYVHPGNKHSLDHLRSDEFVGTWPYIAPEVMELGFERKLQKALADSYTAAVDYWSLGCIVFELEATGRKRNPMFSRYSDVEEYATYEVGGKPYPLFEGMSGEAQSLIFALVCVDPKHRIGSADLRHHPYFKSGSGASEFNQLGKHPQNKTALENVPWVEMDEGIVRKPFVYYLVDPSTSTTVSDGGVDFSRFWWNCDVGAPVRKRKREELILYSC